LINLDLRYTDILGGKPQTAPELQEYVIYAETFKDAPLLENLYIQSDFLGSTFPSGKNRIHPDAFLFNPNLKYIYYTSGGSTTGNISQLFSSNPNLTTVYMQNNGFTGTIPNFQANPNINYINLQNNNLSGVIPGFTGLSNLREIYLESNNLTGIGKVESLTNLDTYQAPNNQLTGQIPSFAGARNLRSLSLRNNQLTSYEIGAFENLTRVNFIDLKFNHLTQTDQDNILIDLYKNWNSIRRGGVTINMKNQRVPMDGSPNQGNLMFPTEAGFSKARILVANGWTIGISGGIPPEPIIEEEEEEAP